MDDSKVTTSSIATVQTVHFAVEQYAQSVGMVITKKSDIQLSIETPLPESLLDIPRIDEIP